MCTAVEFNKIAFLSERSQPFVLAMCFYFLRDMYRNRTEQDRVLERVYRTVRASAEKPVEEKRASSPNRG